MKAARLSFFVMVSLGRVSEGVEPPSSLDSWVQKQKIASAKRNEALKKAGLVCTCYKPRMLFAALAARASKEDPLVVATTPEQRQFLAEYFKIQDDPALFRQGPAYLITESLRRCGIAFPEGTKIQWLVAGSPPLIVLPKPGTIRKIEKYMGLEPYQ
jgi:hypothetical protein